MIYFMIGSFGLRVKYVYDGNTTTVYFYPNIVWAHTQYIQNMNMMDV